MPDYALPDLKFHDKFRIPFQKCQTFYQNSYNMVMFFLINSLLLSNANTTTIFHMFSPNICSTVGGPIFCQLKAQQKQLRWPVIFVSFFSLSLTIVCLLSPSSGCTRVVTFCGFNCSSLTCWNFYQEMFQQFWPPSSKETCAAKFALVSMEGQADYSKNLNHFISNLRKHFVFLIIFWKFWELHVNSFFFSRSLTHIENCHYFSKIINLTVDSSDIHFKDFIMHAKTTWLK